VIEIVKKLAIFTLSAILTIQLTSISVFASTNENNIINSTNEIHTEESNVLTEGEFGNSKENKTREKIEENGDELGKEDNEESENSEDTLNEEIKENSSITDINNTNVKQVEEFPLENEVEQNKDELNNSKNTIDEISEATEEESSNKLNEVEYVERDKSIEAKITQSSIVYQGIALKNPTYVYSETNLNSTPLKSYEEGTILSFQSYSDDWYEATVYLNGTSKKGYIHKNHVETVDTSNQKNLQGIALNNPTKVFMKASTSSNTLKSYSKGTILKFKTFSSEWYVATVVVNGAAQTGYINKSHVETVDTSNQLDYKGIALKDKTYIYKHASTDLGYWKSYEKGSILSYKSYSSEWYVATVYVDGIARTGYISKSDVENSYGNQEDKKGIALKNPTVIYSKANLNSSIIKTYSTGEILKFKTFSDNWYEATFYINGVAQVGYIHHSDVDLIFDKQEDKKGIALKNPTAIYSKTNTSSTKIKTYSTGEILRFKTFSNNWYVATVYINGKAQVGYIHHSDVDLIFDKQEDKKGIALKNPTAIYSKTNTSSTKIKTYSTGEILRFKTFSNNWYVATVYINGKAQVGYIHHSDVDLIFDKQENLKGLAKSSPTNVYSSPTENSSVLKTYRQYHVLSFKTFSQNWYEATVNINGKWIKGYIYKDDITIGTIAKKYYDISLDQALEKQMAAYPKTTYPNMYVHKDALKKDTNGNWKVVGTNWNVRSGPGTNYEILGKLDERYTKDAIVVYGQVGDFYHFSTWIIATKEATRPYLDPKSFTQGSPEYLQFLVLDQPAGLSASVINERILKGKGILEGKGSAFIEAAKKVNINEIYLIAHAMLETGNGTSGLANGDNYNGKVVYNMYGIGASDSCDSPYQCGLKYAYEQGWDTPEKAIIGGAEWIYNKFIGDGKNTLYKMRWNPDGLVLYGYANGQYATDIAWAVKQTKFIYQYYELLDDYNLILEIPEYK
jgi:beta-N-acetylglucosaminidase